ncbi:mitotic fidelity of chromosome transmission- protein [Basidiobolus ranarum]|uniref:Mitotic fidelity of chromosome transmission-protein n=1 Tax=Basidiobolus ranarum TaxID=34480 RepID=A0ABR2WKW5_9FUNG
MELSAGSGLSPTAYLDQSSVSNRTRSSPIHKPTPRSVYSVRKARHVFDESMDSPDIGTIKKKIVFKSKAAPARKSMTSSSPKPSDRRRYQAPKAPDQSIDDSHSELNHTMEESAIADLNEPESVLEPSPNIMDTELDSVLDNSILSPSPSTNRGSKSIPQELNEEVDQALSEDDLRENDIQLSPASINPSPKKLPHSGKASKKPAPKKEAKKVKAQPMRAHNKEEEEENAGVRRSGRTRVKPLDFWRNERIVYGRRKSGPNVVPVVKEIVTIPEDHLALSKRPKKRVIAKNVMKSKEDEEMYNDEPIDEITVIDWYSGEEVKKAIGLTRDMVVTKPVNNQPFEFEKTFGEAAFMSSGIIKIHQNGKKPRRNSGDNAMVFYVIAGSCRVTVHTSTFVISTGGQFHVPRGNQYQLDNVGPNEVRLFFAQARETIPTE